MAQTPDSIRKPASSDGVVSVLSVSHCQRDHDGLQAVLRHSNWLMYRADTCREAVRFLANNSVSVVVCDSSVPDGGWRRLLDFLNGLAKPPVLVVTCDDSNGELWSEVLNLGAYDVLAKPLDRTEVTRIISLAWLYWRDRAGSVDVKSNRIVA